MSLSTLRARQWPNLPLYSGDALSLLMFSSIHYSNSCSLTRGPWAEQHSARLFRAKPTVQHCRPSGRCDLHCRHPFQDRWHSALLPLLQTIASQTFPSPSVGLRNVSISCLLMPSSATALSGTAPALLRSWSSTSLQPHCVLRGEEERLQAQTSRFHGVRQNKRSEKWESYIRVAGKHQHLGCHDSETAAAQAFDQAVMLRHVYCRDSENPSPLVTNFPPEYYQASWAVSCS